MYQEARITIADQTSNGIPIRLHSVGALETGLVWVDDHPNPIVDLKKSLITCFSISRSTRTALIVITVFTAAHLALTAFVGFGVDESYTLSISRNLNLSYFDHPPLHIWIAHFAQGLLGTSHIVRLPFVALSALTSWLMFSFTSRLFGVRAGLWSLIALNLSAFFTVAASDWILPDGPLNMCLLAAAFATTSITGENNSYSDSYRITWITIGFWIGLAALSKYHAFVFGIGLLGFLATTRKYHYNFGRMAPYIGLGLSVLLFSPVLVWNAQHGWASFIFQGYRGTPHTAWSSARLLMQIVGEFLLLAPWISVPLVCAVAWAITRSKNDDRYRLCLWLGLPSVILFTLAPLWGARGMPHWPMPGWLLLFPLLGAWLAECEGVASWPCKWLAASATVMALLVIVAASDSATGWIGASFPAIFRQGDPTIETLEWTQMRQFLMQHKLLGRKHLFVAALSWKAAGKIDQILNGDLPVHVFGPESHGYAFRSCPGGTVGDDAVLIGNPGLLRARMNDIKRYFHSVDPISDVTIGRFGKPELTLGVAYAHRLLRAYPVAN